MIIVNYIIAELTAMQGVIRMITGSDLYIDEILSDNKKIFRINDYQRHYVWKEPQVTDFLKDIERITIRRKTMPDLVHFFGQFIYHQFGAPDRRERIEYEIIDGQQRISTFLLYVAAIKGLCTQHAQNNSSASQLATQCDQYLFSSGEGMATKNKLTLSSVDDDYFQSLLKAISSSQEAKLPKNDCPESHQNLYQAQLVVCNHLQAATSHFEDVKEAMDYLDNQLTTAMKSFQIVAIKTEKAEYTYQLYQVVNDRGEPLHDGELLKAKSAEILDGTDYASRAVEIWNDILRDSGKITDEYLKWAYMSVLGKSPSSDRFYNDFLVDYFSLSPDTEITDDYRAHFVSILEGLYEDIKLCRKFTEGIWPFEDDSNATVKAWQKEMLTNLIVKGKHTLCIPVLLSAFHQPSYRGTTSEVNFAQCLELCENCFILIRLVCSWREDKFKDRYLLACREMRNNPETYRYSAFRSELSKIPFLDVQMICKNNLRTVAYKPKATNTQVKYLLILLERYWHCFENGKLYPKRVPDGFTLINNELSIEHIYAETTKPEELDKDLEKVKHTLGNLLLYGRKANSDLKNKPYPQKKEKYSASPFNTAKYVSSKYTAWTRSSYDEYHEKSIEMLEKILLRFY